MIIILPIDRARVLRVYVQAINICKQHLVAASNAMYRWIALQIRILTPPTPLILDFGGLSIFCAFLGQQKNDEMPKIEDKPQRPPPLILEDPR